MGLIPRCLILSSSWTGARVHSQHSANASVKLGAKLASALIPFSTYYSPGFCARLVGTHTHNSDPLLTYQSVPAVDMTRPTHAIPQRERRIREVAHWSTGVPHLPVKVA